MRATFFGLEIGKRALLTQRTALDVTSHNIANSNTEGYARQRAVLVATDPWTIPSFETPIGAQQLGTGVDVEKIEGLRDKFIDEKIIQEKNTLEQRATADDLMKEVEAIFNEPNDATLRDSLDKFWSAWQDLSIDPSRSELRGNLVEQSQTLIAGFKDIDMRLRRLQGTPDLAFQGSIENQIEDALTQVNSLAHQIAGLNVEIERVENDRSKANDLRDKRQKLVEDLSKLINVTSSTDSMGHLTIRNGNHLLVQHEQVRELFYAKKTKGEPGSLSDSEKYPEFSDTPEVASASLTHTANQRNFTITVQQLAQADSKYSFLTFHPLEGPLSSFGITSGDFTVNNRTMYLDADNTSMKELAQILTEANINVNSGVNESGQLTLTSTLTGTKSAISMKDGTSNLATMLNLQTGTAAQDAIFNIKDQQYVTQENVVKDVVPGILLSLKTTGIANLDLRPIVTGGKMKALFEVRDGNIDALRAKLDEMAYRLITEVNNVHRLGFGLDGITGRNFFKPISTDDPGLPFKDSIQKLSLEDFIINDLNTIGAAQGTFLNPTDRLPSYNGDGDGKNAILIAQVKQKNFFNNGKSNFNDFYNEIVTKAATDSQRLATQRLSSEDMITQLDSKRQELSGVSIDEEMTNLIKFQQAYNAAARVITTVDSLLDKVINGMLR